jgi:hypothetical protein
MALEHRVLKLENQFRPQAFCRVTTWYEHCEPKEAAIARLGKTGPDDVIIVFATWETCTRPGRHRHDDAEVIIHPRRG